MTGDFLGIAITPDVMDVQHEMGSDGLWQSPHSHRKADRFTASEEAMITSRDSFYLATVSQTGWPYIQHRGGPPGFLHLLDETTLAMADLAATGSTSAPATCVEAPGRACF
ncbi:Flavodoxin reductases (ferredoxin-NADPH reductases) family 1 [Raoultella terrigena]|uniref:Flavodoxin reductases (Ferredoxin-NADPH reductases) family 1 n=1 Tax=Raoultella terrigena TaxID=577 RepID=A0A7Z9CPQ4_RAOTE|nr:Flavodoxin reductases (ferredoxin-NADPH reductases) family 1 [Raoultella terrigena]